jgi:hypothetical protein
MITFGRSLDQEATPPRRKCNVSCICEVIECHVTYDVPDTFDTYDQGKNGAITLSELSFALEKLGVHVRLSQLEDTVRKLSKSGAFKI